MGAGTYNSGIPQPMSALKRSNSISGTNQAAPFTASHVRSMSNSRASLAPPRPAQPNFQRTPSGGNLAELNRPGINRASFSTSSAAATVTNQQQQQQQHQQSQQQHQSVFRGRKSLAAGPAAAAQSGGGGASLNKPGTQRRSSIQSRPPSMGPPPGQPGLLQQGPAPAAPPRDPRPLRDRTYQAQLAQQLHEYMATNGFERATRVALTPQLLRAPTQKDFLAMFDWFVRRVDANYRYEHAANSNAKGGGGGAGAGSGNIEAEVQPLLRRLRYPFAAGITKSQIAAVGGQNWSLFLGVLHWLMLLAIFVERFADDAAAGVYDDACAEAGIDVTAERIVYNYLCGAYRDYLTMESNDNAGGDDDDDDDDRWERLLVPHVGRMSAAFSEAHAPHAAAVAQLEDATRRKREQLDALGRARAQIDKLDVDHEHLESDKHKFASFNDGLVARAERVEGRNAWLADECARAERELREADGERARLQAALDAQGVSVEDIDRMHVERERLQKSAEAMAARADEARRRVAEAEARVAARREELEGAAERYNSLAFRAGLVPAGAPYARGVDYELVLQLGGDDVVPADFAASTASAAGMGAQVSRGSLLGGRSAAGEGASADGVGGGAGWLLADPATAWQPQQLVNLDLRGAVKESLTALRKEINERRGAALEADEKVKEQLDLIKESIEERSNEVETLQHKLRTAEDEYEKVREVCVHRRLSLYYC
jgi:kinetochore protein NDC80